MSYYRWFHLPRTQLGTMVPQTRTCFALRHQTQLASTPRPYRIWKRTSPGGATHSPRMEVAARGGIPTHSMQQLSSISSEIQHHQHQGPAKSLSGSRLVDTWMISTARDMSEWREKVTTSIQVHNCFAMYVACHVPACDSWTLCIVQLVSINSNPLSFIPFSFSIKHTRTF